MSGSSDRSSTQRADALPSASACDKKTLIYATITLGEAQPGMKVRYVPQHANGDLNHEHCEGGVISGKNAKYVFVKFAQMHGYGPQHDKACRADQLLLRVLP